MTEFETKLLAAIEKIAENTTNINDSLCEHWEIGGYNETLGPFDFSFEPSLNENE